jgi:hypothetical protein
MTYDYVPEEKTVTKKTGDVTCVLTYMTQLELKQRHGTEHNPFINLPKGIFQRDLIVFELEIISEETSLEIPTTKIGMTIGQKSDYAKNIDKFMLYWRGYLNETDYNFMWDKTKLIILPTVIHMGPDRPIKGYLVFFNNYPPEMGQALITLPVVTDSGDYGNIEIPFYLDDPRAREAAAKKKKQKQKDKKQGGELFGTENPEEDKPSIFDQP